MIFQRKNSVLFFMYSSKFEIQTFIKNELNPEKCVITSLGLLCVFIFELQQQKTSILSKILHTITDN